MSQRRYTDAASPGGANSPHNLEESESQTSSSSAGVVRDAVSVGSKASWRRRD